MTRNKMMEAELVKNGQILDMISRWGQKKSIKDSICDVRDQEG